MDIHQGSNVTDRTNINLRTRQEGHGTIQINRVTTLDLIEDHAIDLLLGFESHFKLDPAFFATGFVTGNHGFAERVFNPVEIDLDFIADDRQTFTAKAGKFFERHAPFCLQAQINDRHIFFDSDHAAFDNRTFQCLGIVKGLVQHGCEVFAARVILCCR